MIINFIDHIVILHAAHIFAIIKAHFTVLTLTRCIWELRVSQEFSSCAPARARARVRSVQGARGGLMMVAAWPGLAGIYTGAALQDSSTTADSAASNAAHTARLYCTTLHSLLRSDGKVFI